MSHADHHHSPQRIAVSSVAAVDACDCGTIHLHIGTVTLHLTPGALVTLARTLRQAAAQVRPPEASDELEAALWALEAAGASPS